MIVKTFLDSLSHSVSKHILAPLAIIHHDVVNTLFAHPKLIACYRCSITYRCYPVQSDFYKGL